MIRSWLKQTQTKRIFSEATEMERYSLKKQQLILTFWLNKNGPWKGRKVSVVLRVSPSFQKAKELLVQYKPTMDLLLALLVWAYIRYYLRLLILPLLMKFFSYDFS